DLSPLYKCVVSGRDARKLMDRVVTRDIGRVAVGQVVYTPWCDEHGKVIDDGTVQRLAEDRFRLTAADPTLRWLRQNAFGMQVTVEDESEKVACLAVQGPTAARILRKVAEADIDTLKYFRITSGRLGGVPVEISRTGYTGDLGYEIWMPWSEAVKVWDALMDGGRQFDLHAAGMLALDVARIEAGLLLIEVDYTSSRRAVIEAQRFTPYEIGLGKLVSLEKESFIGRTALVEEQRRGPKRQLVGLEIDWTDVEARFEEAGLAPQVPATASRAAVPVYSGGAQVGRVTSSTWSPTLKKMIALATVGAGHAAIGHRLQMEMTVEAVRKKVSATVVKLPFFSPPRKSATPPA
ncbi:MAG TPA: aminomethyltransferase family protein, partial [Candidatus Polarisedimenticolia bacterium]|nr:aminomethyltransferase family protein [Candidatus Polarisedimenticolia bacterium]